MNFSGEGHCNFLTRPAEELARNLQPALDCFLPIVYDITKHLTEG